MNVLGESVRLERDIFDRRCEGADCGIVIRTVVFGVVCWDCSERGFCRICGEMARRDYYTIKAGMNLTKEVGRIHHECQVALDVIRELTD